MKFDRPEIRLLQDALAALERGFAELPAVRPRYGVAGARRALRSAAVRMRDNYPYFHPFYMGQMLKPPHPVARIAYALALWINPNNHARDGGRASSAMEKEAVARIARMIGWRRALGHLCGGGTIANFEALWIGRELAPGTAVAASAQAHYTHARLSAVLGVPFREIAVDARGRMDPAALERELSAGGIGTVVATLGTTPAGSVDPLPAILALRERYGFRLHVDAAYGGYFALAGNLARETRASFARMREADSLAIDPHKHGLQPYGCGCVLFRDPSVGRFYRHDSPYTYFTSEDLHLGEISLECSRPGASAVALWTTLKILPLSRRGEFARGLEAGREAALALHDSVRADERFAPLSAPDLDIVVWAVRAPAASESSRRARRLFEAAAKRDLHLALATFPRAMLEAAAPVGRWDATEIVCLRACVLKPEHLEWMPRILGLLRAAADDALGARTISPAAGRRKRPRRLLSPETLGESKAPRSRRR